MVARGPHLGTIAIQTVDHPRAIALQTVAFRT